MQLLYHITTKAEANAARAAGEYVPQSFAQEGFIHCSHAGQVEGVANRYYPGQENLVILVIDPSLLTSEVVEENLMSGHELFPHIYGRLPVGALVGEIDYPCNPDGSFDPPDGL